MKMQKKIGVGHAYVGELEKKYVNMALDAGRLSAGEFVYKFEKKFAQLHQKSYGTACNSGTSALHVALEALKEKYQWPENAEILVPAITFIATSNACIHAGLRPVFVDVDAATYNIDPCLIEEKITEKTVAIIPVHTFGQPCDMDEIIRISRQHNLKIVEDCAEAHFAQYKNKSVGSFSDIAAFSTCVAHTITTGVGGVIITDDSELAEISRSLIAHGRACTCERCIASNPNAVCKLRMQTDMDKRFMMTRMGYSYRVGELEGALGLAQLENRDYIMGIRKKNAEYLTQKLKIFDEFLQLPFFPDYVEHSFMMYPIVVRNNECFTRNDIVHFLESHNIESRPMLPLLNQPIYIKLFGNLEEKYPVAKWIDQNGFYVGCHHGLVQEDLEYMITTITEFIHQVVDPK